MNDKDFFDVLYVGFTNTTRAEDAFWGFEELEDDLGRVYRVFAMTADQVQHDVGSFRREEDAAWVTAVHGCLPDLVRRLHDALDEADRLDTERDEREVAIASLTQEADQLAADHAEAEQNVFRLAVENEELREESQNLQGSWELMRLEISDLRAEAAQLRRERESWVSRAGDALWKIERPM